MTDSKFEEEVDGNSLLDMDVLTRTPIIVGTAIECVADASVIGTSMRMDLQITVPSLQWCKDFQQASPSQRALLLSQVLEDFNDGVPGVLISFSEPVVK